MKRQALVMDGIFGIDVSIAERMIRAVARLLEQHAHTGVGQQAVLDMSWTTCKH